MLSQSKLTSAHNRIATTSNGNVTTTAKTRVASVAAVWSILAGLTSTSILAQANALVTNHNPVWLWLKLHHKLLTRIALLVSLSLLLTGCTWTPVSSPQSSSSSGTFTVPDIPTPWFAGWIMTSIQLIVLAFIIVVVPLALQIFSFIYQLGTVNFTIDQSQCSSAVTTLNGGTAFGGGLAGQILTVWNCGTFNVWHNVITVCSLLISAIIAYNIIRNVVDGLMGRASISALLLIVPKLLIIILVVLNTPFLLTVAFDLPMRLANAIGGDPFTASSNIQKNLQQVVTKPSDVTDTQYFILVMISGVFSVYYVYSLFKLSLSYFIRLMVVYLCFAFSPLALFSLSVKDTERYFRQWMGYLVPMASAPILLGLVFSLMSGIMSLFGNYDPFSAAHNNNNSAEGMLWIIALMFGLVLLRVANQMMSMLFEPAKQQIAAFGQTVTKGLSMGADLAVGAATSGFGALASRAARRGGRGNTPAAVANPNGYGVTEIATAATALPNAGGNPARLGSATNQVAGYLPASDNGGGSPTNSSSGGNNDGGAAANNYLINEISDLKNTLRTLSAQLYNSNRGLLTGGIEMGGGSFRALSGNQAGKFNNFPVLPAGGGSGYNAGNTGEMAASAYYPDGSNNSDGGSVAVPTVLNGGGYPQPQSLPQVAAMSVQGGRAQGWNWQAVQIITTAANNNNSSDFTNGNSTNPNRSTAVRDGYYSDDSSDYSNNGVIIPAVVPNAGQPTISQTPVIISAQPITNNPNNHNQRQRQPSTTNNNNSIGGFNWVNTPTPNQPVTNNSNPLAESAPTYSQPNAYPQQPQQPVVMSTTASNNNNAPQSPSANPAWNVIDQNGQVVVGEDGPQNYQPVQNEGTGAAWYSILYAKFEYNEDNASRFLADPFGKPTSTNQPVRAGLA